MDYVIIVAGGKGLRMGGDIPKQFLPVGGKPILMRTMERFKEYDAEMEIILVLPREQHEYWQKICREHSFAVEHRIATGGETRFHSVQNGLSLIPDTEKGVVGVHDGVRPFVSTEVIARCYDAARTCGAAIPVSPVVETLRYVGDNGPQHNVQRSEYRMVQTPQAFDIQLLKKANRQPYREAFTDDASVVESVGASVTMVDGNRENIKITTPLDMAVAEALISRQ